MIEIISQHDYERLDVFISEYLNITRSKAQSYIKEGFITGSRKLKPSMRVSEGQRFSAEIPESLMFFEVVGGPLGVKRS